MSTTTRLPKSLSGISRLYDPEKRAEALLKLKSPDPYNQIYIALVHSIHTPEAGEAGKTLLQRLPRAWATKKWRNEQRDLELHIKWPGRVEPLVDRQPTIEAFSKIRGREAMAERLLEFALWDEVGFSDLVLRASCSIGPHGSLLRAQALMRGILRCVKKVSVTKTSFRLAVASGREVREAAEAVPLG